MEEFVKGDIVVVPFPFSNLSSIKRRPALVLIPLTGPYIVLCQIASKRRVDDYSIELNKEDYSQGGIFTAEKSIILRRAGNLKPDKLTKIRKMIITLLEN